VYQIRARRSDSGSESEEEPERQRIPLQNITALTQEQERLGRRVNPDTPRNPEETENHLRVNLRNLDPTYREWANQMRRRVYRNRYTELNDEEQMYFDGEHPRQRFDVGEENTNAAAQRVHRFSAESRSNTNANRNSRRRSRAEMEGLGLKGKRTAYCVKCKAPREITNSHETTISNGRKCLKGMCGECGTKLTRFI
jgi:hypothetical protein